MPKTALIVDDDALFQAAIGDGLRAAGYAVTVAANGLEALEMVREAPPDFILLDLIMPKLDGTRTCKILKGHPQHRAIPIIVLTGLGAEGRNALDGLGAEAVVAKRQAELTLAEILETLKRLESSRAGAGPSAEPASDMPPRRIVSELLAERRHTQTLLATLGEGVVELDDRGRVVYGNAAALAMLDRTEDKTLGDTGAELLGGANVLALDRGLREVLADGEGRTVRLDLPQRDKTIGVTLTALPRPEGPPGALLVLRDLTNLARQARGLQALAAVDQHILGKLDLGAVLRKIVTQTAELLGVERCGLYRLERTGDQVHFRCIQGLGLSERYARDLCLPLGQGVVGKAVEERRAVYTLDLLRDPTLRVPAEMRTLLQEEAIEAVLAAPILLPDEAYGTLTVYRPAGHRFTPEEVELVTSLAGSAAIAIENARLFHGEQERRRELEAVRAVTAEITRELDLTTLLELIQRRAAELVGATSGAIYLWDEEAQALIPQAWQGRGAWMREVRFRPGEALTGTVAHRREGMVVNDYRSWPHASPLILERTDVTAILAEPLLYRDRLLGVITLNNQGTGRAFTAQDREVLALLAAQAALAIENARLFGEVSRAKTEWENTFDSIADLVAVLDLEGRIVRANRALLHRLGLPPEQVLFRTCTEVFGDDEAACGGCPHRRAVHLEGPVALELEHPRLSGSYAVSVFPVRDAGGRIMGTVHIARDITEQKAIQAKLAQADKLASMGTLAAGVAHNINNVLGAIVARTDLLLTSATDAEMRRSLEVILQAAMDGAETVRRMREFTRIEPSGVAGLVDVNGAARDALELTQARWRDEAQVRGAPITVETRLEARAPIEGNAAEIREVLVNLILNAVDAMAGGGCLRIATADRPGPPPAGVVEVRVEDTGVGMSEAVRRRIFDPFFTTKGPAGTGLGLSVSYGLVAKHRGEIAVRSREGEGSAFLLSFPMAQGEGGARTAPATAFAPRRGRVLLIEDEPNLREALAEALDQAGHQVEAAEGGREGVERFRPGAFDVVLTDLGMPGMSGLDVARAVKEADPSVYVLLCTGWGEVTAAEVPLQKRGVDALLAKPLRMEDVGRAVRAGLEARAAAPA